MALSPGTRLGPYELVAPLGAGGMGEVWRARDTRLAREIAIKVLPAELASDCGRLRRFEKEARSASALNHPNIITIYDTGFSGGVPWISMEKVEGKTLRELLVPGALPLRKLLSIAAQIADGLARAHEAGIVHRDLKPENVMVRRDGLVKILDFGLAKPRTLDSGSPEASQLATETGSSVGVVLGTVSYMSPEQAAGQPMDFRSDQFSFGSILYEMLTGKRAFRKATAVDTLSAILHDDPKPIAELSPEIPAMLRWIAERCLAKEPKERYCSTGDLARDLSSLREHFLEPPLPPGASGMKRRLLRFAVGAAVLSLAVVPLLFMKAFSVVSAVSGPIRSLVVLPLKNYSGDASLDYLADAMTESLISELAQMQSIHVISRTSAMLYKETSKSVSEIARELGVQGIVEGSLVCSGPLVRVTIRLIDARRDRNLWASHYDRDGTDVLALQRELAQAIAREIRLHVAADQERGGAAFASSNAACGRATLEGKRFPNEALSWHSNSARRSWESTRESGYRWR